jgi:RNA polymerase sigma-70 factor (ECF subfamily)
MTESVFHALFDAHYEALRAFATRMTGDASAADDLVQVVFVRIWTRREEFHEGVSRAYLYRSVRNAFLSWLRDRRVVPLGAEHTTQQPGIDPHDPESSLEERRLRRAVIEAVDKLPHRCREVFILVRERGLSYREAGEVLGISPKTVDAHMVQAMRSLRSMLAPVLGEGATRTSIAL